MTRTVGEWEEEGKMSNVQTNDISLPHEGTDVTWIQAEPA
jgi:hypothetical protein